MDAAEYQELTTLRKAWVECDDERQRLKAENIKLRQNLAVCGELFRDFKPCRRLW